jgi:hypothetical protein
MHVDLIAESMLPASPAAVFALSIDPGRFPAMFRGFGPIPGLRHIRLHAPPAVDSTREVESEDGAVMRERITSLDPPQQHAYVLDGLKPPLRWLAREGHADWRFDAAGDGTRVTWRYRFNLTSPLAWPLAAPLLKVFMQGAMRRCLDAMARELARGAAEPA